MIRPSPYRTQPPALQLVSAGGRMNEVSDTGNYSIAVGVVKPIAKAVQITAICLQGLVVDFLRVCGEEVAQIDTQGQLAQFEPRHQALQRSPHP